MMRFYFLLFLFFSGMQLWAQQAIQVLVYNQTTKEPLPYVYVENVSRNFTLEVPESARITLHAYEGDTLLFTGIGFFMKKIIVSKQLELIVFLEEQVYDLSQVTKYPNLSYQAFSHVILSMKPSKDSLAWMFKTEQFLGVNNHSTGFGIAQEGVITALYNTYNKHARIAAKAEELLQKKYALYSAQKKISKELILDILPLPETHFPQFMAYCKFTDDMLMQINEYNLVLMLYAKYDGFQILHPELQKL